MDLEHVLDLVQDRGPGPGLGPGFASGPGSGHLFSEKRGILIAMGEYGSKCARIETGPIHMLKRS